MQNQTTKKLASIVSLAFTAGMVYFAFLYGAELIRDADRAAVSIRSGYAFLSLSLFAVFYLLLSLHWLKLCQLVDREANNTQLLAFFASQPYKYFPTSLFTFSSRAKFARQCGVSLKKSSIAQALENMNIIIAGFITGITALLAERNPLAAVALIFALIITYYLMPSRRTICIRKRELDLRKDFLIQTTLLTILAWVAAGLSLIFLVYAIGYEGLPLLTIIAANSLAYILGILAFFAPGGIGVRELVLVFYGLQAPVIIMWRILTFIFDIVTGLAAALILHFLIKVSPKDVNNISGNHV